MFHKDPEHEAEVQRIERVASQMESLPLRIFYETSADAMLMRLDREVRLAEASGKRIRWVVVDYVQRFDCPKDWGDGLEQQCKTIWRKLKSASSKYGVHVFGLSSLNFAGSDGCPSVRNIYGGRAAAHEADNVLLLWRPEEDGCPVELTRFIVERSRGGADRLKWDMLLDVRSGGFVEVER